MGRGGYTAAEIDVMTLFDLQPLFDYWAEHPTAEAILAAVHKIKVECKAEPSQATMSVAAIRAMFPGGVMKG